MFTGIIQAIGKIESAQPKGGDCRLKIATGKLSLADAALGDSIAVNGVCLTAIELGEGFFCADVSNETLAHTTLKNAVSGESVNLELALTATTRLGGHIVSGHVDGVGRIIGREADGRSIRFTIEAPAELARYIAVKGSICLNGISLTVNNVNGAQFELNIVPHTLVETTLGQLDVGSEVNLEMDVIARYLERLVLGNKAAEAEQGLTLDLLQKSGFIS
jgi:riboflavin synthase